MTRRGLNILLIALVGLLSIGEAYHSHPDGGEGWYLVAFPSAPSSSTTDSSDSDGQTSAKPPTTCPLHFWSSLLAATSLLPSFLLLPPATGTNPYERTPHSNLSWTGPPLSIRAPPTTLS
ncbi:MAG: hypothetical protein ACE5HK_01440 [Candidatus Methylomirabilales bacterium]